MFHPNPWCIFSETSRWHRSNHLRNHQGLPRKLSHLLNASELARPPDGKAFHYIELHFLCCNDGERTNEWERATQRKGCPSGEPRCYCFAYSPSQVNSNTSGCSVAVPRISAFEMEMHPKIRATSPSVPRRRGRPAPTSATRATLLFHNSLRHVSMAPSWVSRSLLLTPFSSCQPAKHVHVLSVLLCYGMPVKEPTSRTPKASHYLWQRVKENENGKRGEIIAEGRN